MRYVWLVASLLALSFLGLAPAAPADAANCQFILGFKTLHDMIPNIVGNCVTNEYFNSANGDTLQSTTGANGQGGLLVWRKADNWTAFTDGFHTWINGPLGLEERLNSQRFQWEWNPDNLPVVPAPTPGSQCHTGELSVSPGMGNAGVGHQGLMYVFTNRTSVPCTFFGYPGAQMLDAQFNPLPTNVIRGGGYLFPDPGPTNVVVPPGGTATFGLEWEVVPVGNETTCPQASYLKITPPDEFDSLIVSTKMAPCGGGTIHVTAIEPVS